MLHLHLFSRASKSLQFNKRPQGIETEKFITGPGGGTHSTVLRVTSRKSAAGPENFIKVCE